MRKLPFVFLLATAAACASDPGSNDPSTVTSELSQPNGGETTADEAPMFGEAAEFDAAAIEPDAAVTDTLATDPGIAAITASPTFDAHRVMIVWGKLPADPGATESRDWSGQIAVSRGALLVGHTVGFEPATDRLLPRPDIQTVAFDSVTRPYIDGLVLRVLEPDTTDATPVTLTYTSAAASSATPVTYSFDLAALEAGPVKVDAGNGYVMIAVELAERACNHGFMRGRWQAIAPKLGVFRGIVTDEVGLPVGHVKGIYGELPSGSNVMFGKFIDHEGAFVGLIAGTYADGEFQATWIDKQGDHGLLHGTYVEASTATGGGFFARYAESTCTEDTAAGP